MVEQQLKPRPYPLNPQDLHSLPGRETLEVPTSPTLWSEAEVIFTALRNVSDHCRRTANELQRNLQDLEQLIGQVSKKP